MDDDPDVRRVLARLLTRIGADVRAAADAESATDHLLSGPPVDLVISDVDLPGKSGIELAAMVRRTSPGTRIVLITGGTAEHRGAADLLLRKPLELSRFRRRLEKVMEERREGPLP